MAWLADIVDFSGGGGADGEREVAQVSVTG